jgi:hypothetical protein
MKSRIMEILDIIQNIILGAHNPKAWVVQIPSPQPITEINLDILHTKWLSGWA